MIDHDESGALVVQVGEGFLLSEPVRPYEGGYAVTLSAEHRSGGCVQLSENGWGAAPPPRPTSPVPTPIARRPPGRSPARSPAGRSGCSPVRCSPGSS
ncbi:hypothetical protein ELQ39_31330 [Streptomyces sp. GB4-14]|nr:hypothetical protein [Streptomyces sp. GB4-14]